RGHPVAGCHPGGAESDHRRRYVRQDSAEVQRFAGSAQDRRSQRGVGMATVPAEEVKAVPLRHWGRWVAAAVIILLVVWLVKSAIDSDFVDFAVVRRFLFNSSILEGLKNTIIISVCAQALGVALGVVFAVMRLSKNPVLSITSWVYIWFFRGV